MRFQNSNGTESEIGGRETGPASIILDGDQELAGQFIGHGRSLLGELKRQMEFGGLLNGQATKEVRAPYQMNGKTMEAVAQINVTTNRHGLADIDRLVISAQKVKIRRGGKCLGFIVQSFPYDVTYYYDDFGYKTTVYLGPDIEATLPDDKVVKAFTIGSVPEGNFLWSSINKDDNLTQVAYDGYPDNHAKTIGNPITHTKSGEDITPEYEVVVMTDAHLHSTSDYSPSGVHREYDEIGYIYIGSSLYGFPVPYHDVGDIRHISKRTDDRGFLTGSGFVEEKGGFTLKYLSNEDGYDALFMIPMEATDFNLIYSHDVVTENTGTKTDEGDINPTLGTAFPDPSFNEHYVYTSEVTTHANKFSVPCEVYEGVYKIKLITKDTKPLAKLAIYLLLEDEGLIKKEFTDIATKYDQEIDANIAELTITVGDFTDSDELITFT